MLNLIVLFLIYYIYFNIELASRQTAGYSSRPSKEHSEDIINNSVEISDEDLILKQHRVNNQKGFGQKQNFKNLFHDVFECSNKIKYNLNSVFRAIELKIEKYLNDNSHFKGLFKLWVAIKVEYTKAADLLYSITVSLHTSPYEFLQS